MVTKQAISRLLYTIGKGHKPNETDKVALNSIIQYINKFESETIQDNSLFAKLYTLVLSEFLSYYGNVDFANQILNKELSRPINYHIQILENRLKTFELDNFFKSKGIVDPFIIGKPISESIERYEKNKKLFPSINVKELLETSEVWSYDNVTSHLNRNINESLNKYKNV